MWILAHFTHNGVPSTGLSPVATIRDVDTDGIVISGASMVEKGDGFYGYYFNAYNPSRDYAVICDSVTLSGVERYSYASSGEYNEVLDTIESTVGVVDVRTTLLRKIQTNRLELFDGDEENWVLYDDDAVTELLTFSVTDKNGHLIVQHPQSPSKRSGAIGSISGSVTPDIYMRKSVYDPDDDGYVTGAESVSDGVYTSTALDVKTAVLASHSPYILGTKIVNEVTIGDGKYLKYDSSTNRLVYSTISGTISGAIYHNTLLGLDSDDHPQYHTDDRGDVRYYTKTEVDELVGNNKSGMYSLSYGEVGATIVFPAPFIDSNYKLFYSLENSIDSPASEYAITTITKTASGFSVHFSGEIDSNSYVLNWFATTSGIGSYTGITEVHDDSSPALGGDLYINSYGLEMDTTPSGNVIHGYTIGYSGEISRMYVDLNDTGVGCPLHMKSNGHWEQCSAASGTARMPCSALALEEDTGLKKILWRGIVRKGAWSWTPGSIIYVSTVDGALSSAAPTISGSWQQPIGIAIASDSIRFDPGFYPGFII